VVPESYSAKEERARKATDPDEIRAKYDKYNFPTLAGLILTKYSWGCTKDN
jgi:hypothetical protein